MITLATLSNGYQWVWQWLPMGVALATCRHTGYIRIGYATYKLSFKASNYSFELWFWVWCVFNSLDNNALSA